jgi:phage gp29-like protein
MPLFIDTRDDQGRVMRPRSGPSTQTLFTSRPKDRQTEIVKPWKPEDIARALRAAEEGDLSTQADLMEHMLERDGELSGYMQTRTLAPAGLKWAVMPRNDSEEAKAAAERVKEIVDGIPNVRGMLLKMADGIGKGISALEIDWREDKTIASVRWIHPKRYRFDWQTDTFMIVPDLPEDEWKPIPVVRDEFKVMIHKPQLRATHPARGGVLRTVVWAFLFRNYSLKDWVTFSEVFGMPLRVGKYPPGSKDKEKNELRDALELLGSDAYAVIDSRVELEFAEATNRGMHPGDAIFSAMGRQMALAILGQDQTNTQNAFGSRAQTEAGGAPVRQDLLEADCEDIQQTIETDLFFPITGWSFDWSVASRVTPIFKLFYEPPDDYTGMSTVDETVHLKLGLPTTWGEIAKRYGRELPKDIDPETIVFFNEYVPDGFAEKPHVIISGGGATTGLSQQQREQQKQDQQDALDAAGAAGAPQPGGKPPLRVIPGGKAQQALNAAFALLARQSAGSTDARLLNPEQVELDAKTEALVPRAAAAMRQLAAPILSVIATSQSLEEIEQRLSQIYPDLDEGAIQLMIRRAWYTSRLFGMAVSELRAGAIDES